MDLWQELDEVLQQRRAAQEWVKVPSHVDLEGNEHADKLADEGVRKHRVRLEADAKARSTAGTAAAAGEEEQDRRGTATTKPKPPIPIPTPDPNPQHHRGDVGAQGARRANFRVFPLSQALFTSSPPAALKVTPPATPTRH